MHSKSILKHLIGLFTLFTLAYVDSGNAEKNSSDRYQQLVEHVIARMANNWHTKPGGTCGSIRASSWCVAGLLYRNEQGDIDKSITMLNTIIRHQINAPGKYYHGAFVRNFHSEKELALLDLFDLKQVYFDYNYREFVGTTFILILNKFSHILPEELVSKMHDSIYLMAEGAYLRNMSAEYSNIAIMQAYLLHFAGITYNMPRWEDRAETLSITIAKHFFENGTLNEYNSPTYDGVSLIALAQWQQQGLTKKFKQRGEKIYLELWRSVIEHYHPQLRNFVGPWFRAYGTDTRQYVSIAGLILSRNPSLTEWPIPDFTSGELAHGHDLGVIPNIELLDIHVPDTLTAKLENPVYNHSFKEVISKKPLVESTAYLGKNYMFGALYSDKGMVHHQSKPVTIHWETLSGEVGAITLSSSHSVKSRAEKGLLSININDITKVAKDNNTQEIRFKVDLKSQDELIDIKADLWQFSGRQFIVKTNAKFLGIKEKGHNLFIAYQFKQGGRYFEIQ